MKQREVMAAVPGGIRAVALSLAIGLLLTSSAHAIFGIEPHFRHGAVYARAIVLSEGGDPIYAEYDTSGQLISEIGPVTGDLADTTVMSATEFNSYITLIAQFREQHQNGIAEDALLVSADTYGGASYLTVDDQPITKPTLKPGTRSVLIRAKAQRFLPDADQLVLVEVPVDLSANPALAGNTISLLLNADGTVHTESVHNIGFKVAFFGEDGRRILGRSYDDTIHGPVAGVSMELGSFIGGRGVTNEEGKYSLFYFVPPCPGFTFEYTTPIWAELRYRNFNPQGAPTLPYYLMREDYTFCNGLGAFPPSFTLGGLMTQVAVIGILASQARPNIKADFPVDVMMLTGRSEVTNEGIDFYGPVTVGGETRYSVQADTLGSRVARQSFDFDGDNVNDVAVLGDFVTRDAGTADERIVFEASDEGPLQGIFLSSGEQDPASDDEAVNQPNFTRLADYEPYTLSQGLLESLSAADLQDTDIYVFRKSNGRLVMERQGLPPSEVGTLGAGTVDDEGRFVYRLLIRGPADGLSLTGRRQDFAEWQSAAKMALELHARESDHLRSGEEVQIIAINRASGYIGSTVTALKSANDSGLGEISFPIQDIRMGPPNLKITAKRAYRVTKGVTSSEEAVNYVIGFEGAGLTTDDLIEIRTEWFAADGTALPAGLGEFGYTGRLARVSGAGVLDPFGGALAEFAIKPGIQLQLVELEDQILNKQHFYVHVSGKPENREPDFGVGGAGSGALQYRPGKYVPVKVQIFDEASTIEQEKLFRKLRRENPDQEFIAPQPVYHEVYRPEFQFSVFDLEVKELNRITLDDEGNEEKLKILDDPTPTIARSDDLVEMLFSLLGSEFERLAPIDGEQELILALGEEEQRVTLGADQTVRFENIETLGDLEPVDFLSMRLYTNSDAANILWQYAFRLDISFISRSGEEVRQDTAVSYPRPVIKLTDHDVNVNTAAGTASVTVSGKLFCDIADLVEDGSANISEVLISVPKRQSGGNPGEEEIVAQSESVIVTDDSSVLVTELRPFQEGDAFQSIEEESHPFVGTFEHTFQVDLQQGTNTVLFEAANVLGALGYASLNINIAEDVNAGGMVLAGIEVDPSDFEDRGFFNPVWVRVENEDIDETNFTSETVTVFNEEHALVMHEDGRFYADRPFMQIANPDDLVGAPNIINALLAEGQNPTIADYEADPNVNVRKPLAFSDTRVKQYFPGGPYSPGQWVSVHQTYAAGTTVDLAWFSDLLEDGWTIDEAFVEERDDSGFSGWLFNRFADDPDSTVLANTAPDTSDQGKLGVRFALEFNTSAHKNTDKRLRVKLSKPGEEPQTVKAAHFKVVPLKTIILAVDGLAFGSANQAIENGVFFNKVFKDGLGRNAAALSAMPTITWANWPGVFSGGPPRDHGWQGNSFFPRETTHLRKRLPIFSSGAAHATPPNMDGQQQAGVASGGTIFDDAYSMDARTLNADAFGQGGGSLYDIVAQAIGKSPDDPLRAYSVFPFYARAGDSVKLDRMFFWLFHTRAHSLDAAKSLDNDEFPRGAMPRARDVWRANRHKLDIMSIYMPGVDNIGHTNGLGPLDGGPLEPANSSEFVEVDDPLAILGDYAQRDGDAALGKLVRQIENDGYLNAVVFALTADHGQHAFRNRREFVLRTLDAVRVFETPERHGGMGKVAWRDEFFEIDPATQELQIVNNYNDAEAAYSPNGVVGHYYLKGANWQSPPPREDVLKLAHILYRESRGHLKPDGSDYASRRTDGGQIWCGHAPRKAALVCREYESEDAAQNPIYVNPEVDANLSSTEGVFGEVPAIFVKVGDGATGGFEADYQWVKAVNETIPPATAGNPNPAPEYEVVLDSIDAFIATAGVENEWPAFKQRIAEMNHKHPNGSRSGDVLTMVDGKRGYLTVNNEADEYPGWHGGPSRSESFVPLFFAMPGQNFVTAGFGSLPYPEQFPTGYNQGLADPNVNATLASDGYTRNWQLAHILKEIVKQFRDE